MHHLTIRNVNHALPEALWWLHAAGKVEPSRNGAVLVAPGSGVCVTYTHPLERVLFSALRDCNPYFHFFEALWMLGGRQDVAFVAQFNPRMRDYSDDGVTLHGAYGHRWRHHFDFDQLSALVALLRNDPHTRRAVLSMWDPYAELTAGGKDLPCNTHCYLDRRGAYGALNLLVMCRSNDAIWGAYGANAVHFSYLLEYLAAAVGCSVGRLDQLSFNLHAYVENAVTQRLHHAPEAPMELGAPCVSADDRYDRPEDWHARPVHDPNWVSPYPLLQPGERLVNWDRDLRMFLEDPGGDTQYKCEFFNHVAAMLYASWTAYKVGHLTTALRCADAVAASDWRLACREWLQRRVEKREATNAA